MLTESRLFHLEKLLQKMNHYKPNEKFNFKNAAPIVIREVGVAIMGFSSFTLLSNLLGFQALSHSEKFNMWFLLIIGSIFFSVDYLINISKQEIKEDLVNEAIEVMNKIKDQNSG